MRIWRLVAGRHVDAALTGHGAARYGGRWNPTGTRMIYGADSLALATLELSVHLVGARVTYRALELEIPRRSVEHLDPVGLDRRWADDESITQLLGAAWCDRGKTLAITVPSALVDARSGERNVLVNPRHARAAGIAVVQAFDVTLDERL